MKEILVLLLGLNVFTHVLASEEANDPAQIAIGERLFLETRFAQAYHANPAKADPVLNQTVTTSKILPGAFAGKTISCRACHMVDEFAEHADGGMRTYADYARMSPIPDRQDGKLKTSRNSMALVNISIPSQEGVLLHFDGEFNTMEDLVRGTLTGRNYGWQAGESKTAIAHIAKIVRTDDGTGELVREFGGSYHKILTGTDKDIAEEFHLPAEYRLDVAKASDRQILDAVARLIAAYVTDLSFAQDDNGNYIGSPYDVFLQKNNLPRKPANGESLATYSQRLLTAVYKLAAPRFVDDKDGRFATHKQKFVFGKKELQGMKLFFTRSSENQAGGNCISCHSAPHFSDYKFHNTGLTQHNYDNTHGAGAFSKLDIPDLQQRNAAHDAYLPVTTAHPDASSRFRSGTSIQKPGYTDLGLWNIFANPDMPAPQQKLRAILCQQAAVAGIKDCQDNKLLERAIAAFKTPVLRDLGHSAPYMHTAQFDDLKQVVSFYISSSAMARNGQLRNNAAELTGIHINPEHVEPLVAFIKSLNEDYD
jgi:cytochrome c peroxidase